MSPRTWLQRAGYLDQPFEPAFEALRAQRAELLGVLEAIEPGAWERTASVRVPPRRVMEYSARYIVDRMARHERGHLKHMARVIDDARAST